MYLSETQTIVEKAVNIYKARTFLKLAHTGRRAPGFLKSLLCGQVCVCVYVSSPEAINN